MLLEENGAAFQHQISVGSSVSGNSMSGEDTPKTTATMVSESPFTFENVSTTHSMSVPTLFAQDNCNGAGYFNRSGSATLPVANGSPLFPIPEDAPATLPYRAMPPRYPYSGDHPLSYSYYPAPPSSVGAQEKYEDDPVEMTDNPFNHEFEKKMVSLSPASVVPQPAAN